jgi:YVTN family beta-propeller protein
VTRVFGSYLLSSLSVLLYLFHAGAAEAQIRSYAFVPNMTGATNAVVIDTTTHTVVASTISTPYGPKSAAASPDGRVVYLVSDRIHVVNVATRMVIGEIATGIAPHGTAFTRDGRRAYVLNGDAVSSISIIDVFAGSAIPGIWLPSFSYPRYVELSPDDSTAYVTSENGLYIVDLATNTVAPPIATGPLNGIAILPDGRTAFVAERSTNQVLVIDLLTQTVDPTPIPVGSQPFDVKLSPDKTVIYVSNN